MQYCCTYHQALAETDRTTKIEETKAAEAKDAESQFNSLRHQAHAIELKTSQISKHKVVVERIAQDRLKTAHKANKHRLKTRAIAQQAATDKAVIDKAKDEAVVEHGREADVLNLKTAIGFRALHDKVISDVEREHHTNVDKQVHSHDIAVRNAVWRDLPYSSKSAYVITRNSESAASNGPYEDPIAEAMAKKGFPVTHAFDKEVEAPAEEEAAPAAEEEAVPAAEEAPAEE
jgi:hypothetical protein